MEDRARAGLGDDDDAEYLAVTRLQADALVTVNPTLATKAKNLAPLTQLEALTEDRD